MKASHFQPFAMPLAFGRRCHTFGQFDLSLDTTSFPLTCIIILDYKPQNMLCVRHRRPFLYIFPKAPTLILSSPLIKSLPGPELRSSGTKGVIIPLVGEHLAMHLCYRTNSVILGLACPKACSPSHCARRLFSTSRAARRSRRGRASIRSSSQLRRVISQKFSFSEESMLIRKSTLRREMLRLMVPFLVLDLNLVSCRRNSSAQELSTYENTPSGKWAV